MKMARMKITQDQVPPHSFDPKYDRPSRQPILKTMNAMLNSKTGGTTYLGVSDDATVRGLLLNQYKMDRIMQNVQDVRTLSLTKSPLLHPGCWQGQSLILSCTVMTNHLPVQNYIKVNFWRSDTAFEITMSFILTAQKMAVEYPLQPFLTISPKLADWLIVRASSQLSYMLSFWGPIFEKS